MQIFRNTNFDFLGKKWPFIIASLVLTVAGLISLTTKGGPKYGIDFKGGTLMTVKFQGPPPVNDIRSALSKKIKGEIMVQNFEASSREVAIGTEIKDERQLGAERQLIAETLQSTFGQPASGRLDFNNASQQALVDQLRDPLQRNNVQLSEDQVHKLAADMLAFRNSPPQSGLISSFDQLSAVPGVNAAILNTLKQVCYLSPFSVRGVELVGPKVGADLQRQAILATLYALGGMLVYIAFRFEWIYGVAAVVALAIPSRVAAGVRRTIVSRPPGTGLANADGAG